MTLTKEMNDLKMVKDACKKIGIWNVMLTDKEFQTLLQTLSDNPNYVMNEIEAGYMEDIRAVKVRIDNFWNKRQNQ